MGNNVECALPEGSDCYSFAQGPVYDRLNDLPIAGRKNFRPESDKFHDPEMVP